MPVPDPVLAILLRRARPGEPSFEALREIGRRHPGHRLVLLTTPEAAPFFSGLADEIWPDGAARGPLRFLALVRRVAWAHIGHVYDLEATPLTRLMRFCVRPRPQWYGPEAVRPPIAPRGPVS